MPFMKSQDMFLGCDGLIHLYARENYKMTLEYSENAVSIKNYFEEYLCYDYIEFKFYFDDYCNVHFELIDQCIFKLGDLYLSFSTGKLSLEKEISRIEVIDEISCSSELVLRNIFITETLLFNENFYLKQSSKEESFFVNYFIDNNMGHLIPNYHYISSHYLLIEKYSHDLSQIKIEGNNIVLRHRQISFNFDIRSYIKTEITKIIEEFVNNNIFDSDFYDRNFVISFSEFPVVKRIDLELCILCKTKEECIKLYKENYDENYIEFILSDIL